MFRLATCNDLLALKAKYPEVVYPEKHAWGLKQLGTLFCFDRIKMLAPPTLLEVGAGHNRFFDQHVPPECEYWMADSPGFYDAARYEAARLQRTRTRMIDSLLGSAGDALPADYFAMVFSVSVLEHVPVKDIPRVCQEMFRVLKPGGYAVHTIDLTPMRYETLGKAYQAEIGRAGGVFVEEPSVDYARCAENGVLFETLQYVVSYYYKKTKLRIDQLTSSVAVVAQKAH